MNAPAPSWARALVPLALTAAAAAPARADLLVYEPFAYPDGLILDGDPASGSNLSGLYSDPSITGFKLSAAAPGLGYGNLLGPIPAATGNRLTQVSGTTAGASSVDIDQDVSIEPGESIYFSALFTFDDSSNGNRFARISLIDDSTGHQIHFGEAGVGVRTVRIEADMTAAGGDLIADGADGSFTDGQTLWLIGRYTNGAAPNTDALDLIGYDTAGAFAIAPAFDPADPNAQFAYSLSGLEFNLSQLTSLRFSIRGDNNNFIDELRIGETYADVAVPTPGALFVLTAATALGVSRRRRT